MKTKIHLSIMFLILACSVFGQTVKKEFYDFKKTKIMAEYQVNAAGEKNGWFKGYNENGVVVEEAMFKNGQLNGVYKKYSTNSGKREITQSETYKDGVLNGAAQYYGTMDNKPFVQKEGNFLDGERNGKWLIIKPTPNYNIKEEEKKGCEYVKEEVEYQKGNEVSPPDGKRTIYYFPSGKVRCEEEYTNGIKTGQHKWYYPNGKLEAEYIYDGQTKKYLKKKTYYTNGQLWEDFDWSSGKEVLMDYNEDGSPGLFSKRNMAAQKEANAAAKADSAFTAGNFDLGFSICNDSKINTDYLFKIVELEKKFNSNQISAEDAKYKLKDIEYYNDAKYMNSLHLKHATTKIASLKTKITEVAKMDENIKAKEKEYAGAYTESINNGTAWAYPKGENIYFKSKSVLEEILGAYNKAASPDEKLKTGTVVLTALDRMIAISTNEQQCKDFNKQLKKVEDKAQIKTILGL